MEESLNNEMSLYYVKKLYGLVYPFSTFDGDYSAACIAVKKEIMKLCRDKRKDLLIVISKAIDLPVNIEEDIHTICKNIMNNLIEKCM